jgi:hypothetical protein
MAGIASGPSISLVSAAASGGSATSWAVLTSGSVVARTTASSSVRTASRLRTLDIKGTPAT